MFLCNLWLANPFKSPSSGQDIMGASPLASPYQQTFLREKARLCSSPVLLRSRSRNSSAAVGANSCSLMSTPRTQYPSLLSFFARCPPMKPPAPQTNALFKTPSPCSCHELRALYWFSCFVSIRGTYPDPFGSFDCAQDRFAQDEPFGKLRINSVEGSYYVSM